MEFCLTHMDPEVVEPSEEELRDLQRQILKYTQLQNCLSLIESWLHSTLPQGSG